jgi:hypothetical protein
MAKRQISHAQLVAGVRRLPDGPEKDDMLARLDDMREIQQLVGKIGKAIKERKKAEANSTV